MENILCERSFINNFSYNVYIFHLKCNKLYINYKYRDFNNHILLCKEKKIIDFEEFIKFKENNMIEIIYGENNFSILIVFKIFQYFLSNEDFGNQRDLLEFFDLKILSFVNKIRTIPKPYFDISFKIYSFILN